jgi:flavin reductase (DIM6/NTAB) family NADH-FMN oxidoreductase RutF
MSDLGAAMGRIPSGIFILTATHGENQTGMLASWIMQCSFDPPMVTAAVRKDRYLVQWLKDGASVAVNILSEDEKNMISHFGRGFEPGAPAFTGIDLLEGSHSAPVLADALAYLEATVESHIETGDHVVFVLRCTGGRLLAEGQPMTHIRKDGMRY